ncbi:MAG: hypothetical protein WKG00_06655 [Polyangiaceae bacterium]
MPRARRPQKPAPAAVTAALCAAALSVAGHVLGKAVRDTLYLTTFPVEWLPYFFLATGVCSMAAVSIYTRLTAKFGPTRAVATLAFFTALTMPVFWWKLHAGGEPWVVGLLYLWTTLSGTFIVSGFWSVLGEAFDPRAARNLFGLVGVATTAGGLAGGFGAHGLLRLTDAESLLLALAAVNLLMAVSVVSLANRVGDAQPGNTVPPPADPAQAAGLKHGVRQVLSTSYLRHIAMLVVAVTVAGTLADYLLKDLTARSLTDKRDIAAFFSLARGAVGAVTLGVQILVCRPLLARKGLPAALTALPLWLLGASALVLATPVLWAATALRGGENAVRNSFYRSGYELLFVPLPAAVKRATKPVLDALVERLADAGGAAVVLILVTWLGHPAQRLVWVIMALALWQVWLAGRVRRGYVETLSSNLLARAVELDEVTRAAGDDATARDALRNTLLGQQHADLRRTLSRSQLGMSLMKSLRLDIPKAPTSKRASQSGTRAGGIPAALLEDPVLELVHDLASSRTSVARTALERWDRKDRRAVPFLIRLLAREELYRDVISTLATAGDRIVGTLVDHLHDPDEAFAVRRRIPRALAACQSAVAVEGLLRGLADRRFEVRFYCAEALERIQAAASSRRVTVEPVWAAIREEVKKSRSMWEAQRLLDDPEEVAPPTPGLARAVERRGAHSLRHVFRLLGLVLDTEPVTQAYRAVRGDDPSFRSIGLEYLENVLPADVKRALWPLVGDDEEAPPLSRSGRSMKEVMRELAASGLAVPAPKPSRPDGEG